MIDQVISSYENVSDSRELDFDGKYLSLNNDTVVTNWQPGIYIN